MNWTALELKMQRHLKSRVRFSVMGDFLSIRDIDFFGPFSVSPNQRYILAWSDSDPESGRAGCRKRGHGTYILLEDARLILYGRQIKRPNHGKVADNGTFIFNDWLFGLGAKGTFYAFDRQGNVIIKKKVSANLYNNGLSSDGWYAVAQTCHTEKSFGKLYFFDLREGQLLWTKEPETGWADYYEFDISSRVLYLVYRDGKKYAYGFNGKFLEG